MKNYLFVFLFIPTLIIGQDPFSDTIKKVDSLKYIEFEKQRNYLGVNITPLMTGIVSNQNDYNIKLSAIYKRNFGYKNLRFSLNYLSEGSSSLYDFYLPINTTDSSIYYRYFNTNYQYTDFRIGFEELRGYSDTRVHVGVDAIFGYGKQNSNYFHKLYEDSSSSGIYYLVERDSDHLLQTTGDKVTSYLVTGLDVSFGIDWMLNDAFMFTFQITPQFNYYIFRSEQVIDPFQEYIQFGNYADFKLGYFDLNLIYKF